MGSLERTVKLRSAFTPQTLPAAAGRLPPSRALASVGVDVEAVARGVVEAVGEGTADAEGRLPFTPRAKRVLEMALKEGLKSEAKQVEPEHVLSAILREGGGLAVSVLVDLGASVERVREGLERTE